MSASVPRPGRAPLFGGGGSGRPARGSSPRNTNNAGTTLTSNNADTGFWGVRLDGGTLTPVAPLTFERRGDQVTAPSDLLLWQVSSLSNYSMNVQVHFAVLPSGEMSPHNRLASPRLKRP